MTGKALNIIRSNTRSYREIFLLWVLGNALEKIMVGHLEVIFQDLLSDAQYGIHRVKSTENYKMHSNVATLPWVNLEGRHLSYVRERKYLGTAVGEKLSFGSNVAMMSKKMTVKVVGFEKILRKQ